MSYTVTKASMPGFRTEDISFQGARRQREILNEIPKDMIVDNEPEIPVSNTPEQVIKYYEECIAATEVMQKKHIYGLTIKWLREFEKMKQEQVAQKVKDFVKSKEEDIEEIEVD